MRFHLYLRCCLGRDLRYFNGIFLTAEYAKKWLINSFFFLYLYFCICEHDVARLVI